MTIYSHDKILIINSFLLFSFTIKRCHRRKKKKKRYNGDKSKGAAEIHEIEENMHISPPELAGLVPGMSIFTGDKHQCLDITIKVIVY